MQAFIRMYAREVGLRFLVTLGLVTASCMAQAGTPVTIEGVTLELPDEAGGWARKDSGGGFLLQKSFPASKEAGRDKASAALIQIFKPLPKTGRAFADNYTSMVRAIPELADKRPTTKSAGVTVNGHPITVERRCCGSRQGVSLSAIHVGVEGPASQVFLGLVLLGRAKDEQKAVEAEFEAIVRSLRFTPSDAAFELIPPKGAGGIDAAYTHLDTGLRPNAFGGMDFYSDSEIMLFAPDGLYARELPKGGMDIKAYCRAKPTDCGTYRLLGGGIFSGASQIELLDVKNNYGVLELKTESFERKGAGFKIGKADYREVPPIAKGTRLQGAWRSFFASSGMTATSSGSVASERMLTLSPDGTFVRTGWSGVSTSNEIGNTRTSVTGSNDRPIERGRYEIDGYQLTLTGEDGRMESLSVFRPDRDSDDLLVINGANYLKKDAKKAR